MPEEKQWEYHFIRMGGAFRTTKTEDVEALLNEWGEQGWEVVGLTSDSNTLMLLAKRPLSLRIRRERSMPGYS
ncbi:MAG TPA: DUF4177 domain-containing protein [Anaerolineales bacterium]|jgi:hypothetical protein|nr:DUF4177 domain-containing protein [Anaerolineales bacterium]